MAREAGMDLIEVSPAAKPPVVRVAVARDFILKGAGKAPAAASSPAALAAAAAPAPSATPTATTPTAPATPPKPAPQPHVNLSRGLGQNELKEEKEVVVGSNISGQDMTRAVDRVRMFLLRAHPVKLTVKLRRSNLTTYEERPMLAQKVLDAVADAVKDICKAPQASQRGAATSLQFIPTVKVLVLAQQQQQQQQEQSTAGEEEPPKLGAPPPPTPPPPPKPSKPTKESKKDLADLDVEDLELDASRGKKGRRR